MPAQTVYALGEKGVNVVKSPVHLEDGELTQAQNAVFNPEGEEGGLQKRGGLTALNSALAGAIKGLTAVPLPDPGVKTTTLYVAIGEVDATNTWYSSTNGTTWVAGTSPGRASSRDNLTGPVPYFHQRVQTLGGVLYYPSDAYTPYDNGPPAVANEPPPVYAYNGTTDLDVATLPYNPIAAGTNAWSILDSVVHQGVLYVSCFDPEGSAPSHRGRVFALDPSTGTLTQTGNRFGGGTGENPQGMPFALASYNGYLWAGTFGIVGGGEEGKIYRIRPGFDESWTLDHTTAAGQGYIMSMVGYGGSLYASTMCEAASAPLILVRPPSGTWATSFTASTTTGTNYIGSLTVFDGNLYAAEVDIWGGTTCLIKAFDGTTWTTDLDVGATYADQLTGQTLVHDDVLYWVFASSDGGTSTADGFLLRRTSAGVWTQPIVNKGLRGFIGKVVA